jgi:hypothetical protein
MSSDERTQACADLESLSHFFYARSTLTEATKAVCN